MELRGLSVQLKPKQEEAVKYILQGRDVICNLPVGYGKSMIFHVLPELLKQEKSAFKVLVVCPLTALMEDQLERLKSKQIKALFFKQDGTSIKNYEEHEDIYADIIFGHPESFLKCKSVVSFLHEIDDKVGAIIVDECHKIDDWGKEFRKSFTEIGSIRSFFPSAPMVCLSATITESQISIIKKSLDLKSVCMVSLCPDINHFKLFKILKDKGNTMSVTESIFKSEIMSLKEKGSNYPVTLFFIPLQYMAYAMKFASSVLPSSLIEAKFCAVYSGQEKSVLNAVFAELRQLDSRFRLIFCTCVIGMGFDSPCITRVIHIKPPRSLTDYFQEIGRMGRRGQKSEAILYYNRSDISKNLPGIKEDIMKYCTSSSCLRKMLLNNFGFFSEEFFPEGCSCCSTCSETCVCSDCLMCRHVTEMGI